MNNIKFLAVLKNKLKGIALKKFKRIIWLGFMVNPNYIKPSSVIAH